MSLLESIRQLRTARTTDSRQELLDILARRGKPKPADVARLSEICSQANVNIDELDQIAASLDAIPSLQANIDQQQASFNQVKERLPVATRERDEARKVFEKLDREVASFNATLPGLSHAVNNLQNDLRHHRERVDAWLQGRKLPPTYAQAMSAKGVTVY
jgi:chromosome segregation ATPase